MDIKKGKDTFISKLLTIENYRKSDVRVVYEFLQNEFHKSSIMLMKVN